MAVGGQDWPVRLARAARNIFDVVAGHGRADIADPCILRVGARAWDDLDQDPDADELHRLVEKHRILKRFYDTYSSPHAVDTGVTIDEVDDPKVFRIKNGDWRGAVRYIPEDGAQWLCRNLSLAKFHEEHDAYVQFGKLEGRGLLLPEGGERERARGDQFLLAMVRALQEARVEADQVQREWCTAHAARPDGTALRVGRMYAEFDEDYDEHATAVWRYMLLVRRPPPHLKLPAKWLEYVLAEVFPSDEPVKPTGDLPKGTNARGDETPFLQESLEVDDEDDDEAFAIA